MGDDIGNAIFTTFRYAFLIGLPMGPALYLWYRSSRGDDHDADTLRNALVWTAFWLALHVYWKIDTGRELSGVCARLERELQARHGDDFDLYADLPNACSEEEPEGRYFGD